MAAKEWFLGGHNLKWIQSFYKMGLVDFQVAIRFPCKGRAGFFWPRFETSKIL
jgi:hypothetical protein